MKTPPRGAWRQSGHVLPSIAPGVTPPDVYEVRLKRRWSPGCGVALSSGRTTPVVCVRVQMSGLQVFS
ncbi:MAG: hypothetical protein RBT06_09035, partial [Smithellaceae bacterium]|nr:hypothetical protein [Smithellaceae bacterium]